MKRLSILLTILAYPLIAGAVTHIGPPVYCNGNYNNVGGCYTLQQVKDVGIKYMETSSQCFCQSIGDNSNCTLQAGITYSTSVYQVFSQYCRKNIRLVQGTVLEVPQNSPVVWTNITQAYVDTIPHAGSCGGGGGL